VQNVSFDLHAGETLAIVGESGSGKSVTALSIMRLVELGTRGRITSGEIELNAPNEIPTNLVDESEDRLREIRGGIMSMIFQEPLTALNPVYSIESQITEAVRAHRAVSKDAAREMALEIMKKVRIPDPEKRLKQYPHEKSGGMRQRIMIAQALVLNPQLLICDEPTTALDVTIQAQILRLIKDLQEETGAAVIMITHDMGVVAEVADRVVVMKDSKVVEQGDVQQIFADPQEPYTKALLAAVPRLGSMNDTDEPAKFPLVETEVG
jgi:peptide/nickel transport system ATP-binding protein/glutathione transport system ATP-binding protein